MPTPEYFTALRRAPILAGLSEDHLRGLLRHLKRRTLTAGEALFKQGWRGDFMAVVADGAFQASVTGTDGRETPVSELSAGDVVGEMACVDPAPRSATVMAKSPAVVYCLSRSMLLALRDKGPAVAMAILSGVITQVTDRIRRTNMRIEERMQGATDGGAGRGRDTAGAVRSALGAAAARSPRLHREPVDLSKVGDLGDLTSVDLEILSSVARCLRFEAGALLCAEGEAGESCYVMVEGEVDVIKLVGDSPRTLTTLSGCLLGQMALVDPGPRSATLRAGSAVVALELGRDTFTQLLGEHSPFAMRFQDMLAVSGIRQLREANARLAAIPVKGALFQADKPGLQRRETKPSGRGRPSHREDSGRGRPSHREENAATQPRLKKRRLPPGGHPVPKALDASSEGEALSLTLAYMQASLEEWGMSMDELDGISVHRCEGVMGATERRSRLKGDF